MDTKARDDGLFFWHQGQSTPSSSPATPHQQRSTSPRPSAGDGDAASKILNTALQEATEKIDELGDLEFREVKVIMEQMKENASLWGSGD